MKAQQNENLVQVYTNKNLAFLLNGRKPPVSRAERPKSSIAKARPNPESPSVRFGEIPRVEKREVPTPRYNKLRKDQEALNTIDEHIAQYEQNTDRRRAQIHDEWEARFMAPFGDVMRKRLHGRPYTEYKGRRARAVTALDALPADAPFVPPPTLRFPTSGLNDRVHNFQEHARQEAVLERFVRAENGIPDEKPKLRERDTMDVHSWRVLPETRFFAFPGDLPVAKGKRIFPAKYRDGVAAAMSQF